MELFEIMRQMPKDWEDAAGWDHYYTLFCESGYHLKELIATFDLMLVGDCLMTPQRSNPKIWFPGCGVTLVPRFCALGRFRVWASDISGVAIRVCKEMEKDLEKHEKLSAFAKPITEGELHFIQHDLRTPFVQGDFDYIVDVKTFQGLSSGSKAEAARVYRDSLTQGGQAVFVLVNVREEYHNEIKEIIERSGFHLTKREADAWFFSALGDTGIPYTRLDKRPCVRKDDERYTGAKGQLNQKRDQTKLDRLTREYQKRLDDEFRRLRQVSKETNTRIAYLRFWTG